MLCASSLGACSLMYAIRLCSLIIRTCWSLWLQKDYKFRCDQYCVLPCASYQFFSVHDVANVANAPWFCQLVMVWSLGGNILQKCEKQAVKKALRGIQVSWYHLSRIPRICTSSHCRQRAECSATCESAPAQWDPICTLLATSRVQGPEHWLVIGPS